MSLMLESIDLLRSVRKPWFQVWETNERDLDDSLTHIGLLGIVDIRIVRGMRCKTPDMLFHEWAAALQFPWYFGNNWNAFDDCLDDLSWLHGRPLLLAITNINLVLCDAPEEFKLFADTLSTVARRRNAGKDVEELDKGEEQILVPFHIGFHCEANAGEGAERLRRAGIYI